MTEVERTAAALARAIGARRRSEDGVVATLDVPVVAASQAAAALPGLTRATAEERAAWREYEDALAKEAAG